MTRDLFYAPHGFIAVYIEGTFALTVRLYNGAMPS